MIIKKLKYVIPIFIVLLTNSCSYQKMNSVDQKKFDIKEFEVIGDARESFIVQKKIQRFSNKNSDNKVKLLVKLKKNKTIQEKNIQNKVTKYNLTLSANVVIIDLNTTKEVKRKFTASQVYNVDDSYSDTVENFKDANNSLIDKIIDEILDQLRIYYN